MKITKSRFSVPELDCPSEEQTIRLALAGKPEIKKISVDFEKRELTVFHSLDDSDATRLTEVIPYRAVHLESISDGTQGVLDQDTAHDHKGERRVLFWLLGLNFAMFLLEIIVGISAQSSGLVADGLDMLADSLVYLLGLVSIGLGLAGRIRATRLSAFLQGSLGVWVLVQAFWRFINGSDPEPSWMVGISLLALLANVTCLVLISRFRTGRMHMQASWIFSANDVIANISVIIAGALVLWTGSRYPDLIVGAGICILVLRGALKIRRLAISSEVALAAD